ncbi:MAG: DNA-binding response regulator [Betaproteobacteria bacterium]|jgi:FixJ family two-component response regulator|nr:DNA-binding response regulator [Betaproteobacteria bacterium]
MSKANSRVYLVEDSPDVRWQLQRMLTQQGFDVSEHADAASFLTLTNHQRPAVLVSDMRMPGISGLELLRRLRSQPNPMPVIFISGESHPQEIIDGMKEGAVEFLWKPFRSEQLLQAIERSLALDNQSQLQQKKTLSFELKMGLLSSREKEVLPLMLHGHANKSIAQILNILPDTVKKHRAQIMEKMQVHSLPELIEICADHPSN